MTKFAVERISNPPPETIRLERMSIPFLKTTMQLAQVKGISIPVNDISFIGQSHASTKNYLLAQAARQSNLDTTGILPRLAGFVKSPDETAFIVGAAAQNGLSQIEFEKGKKAKMYMLGVLFGQEEPTLDALLNLDKAWGTTVDGLKVPPNETYIELGKKAQTALYRLANEQRNLAGYNTQVQNMGEPDLAILTQRQFESAGGRIVDDISEELILPKVLMPEVDAITPPMLQHGWGKTKPPVDQTDLVRFIRMGGRMGNDLLRATLALIKDEINNGRVSMDEHLSQFP